MCYCMKIILLQDIDPILYYSVSISMEAAYIVCEEQDGH